MIILGIDPGPENSWWVTWDTKKQRILSKGIFPNARISPFPIWVGLEQNIVDVIVIENIQCFGMPVGAEVFETAKAIGRFLERAKNRNIPVVQIGRREIKLHFCNSTKAKDSNIRQVILDRFGGKEKAIGKKKSPGVLYGVKKDLWSALALCLWYAVDETCMKGR